MRNDKIQWANPGIREQMLAAKTDPYDPPTFDELVDIVRKSVEERLSRKPQPVATMGELLTMLIGCSTKEDLDNVDAAYGNFRFVGSVSQFEQIQELRKRLTDNG